MVLQSSASPYALFPAMIRTDVSRDGISNLRRSYTSHNICNVYFNWVRQLWRKVVVSWCVISMLNCDLFVMRFYNAIVVKINANTTYWVVVNLFKWDFFPLFSGNISSTGKNCWQLSIQNRYFIMKIWLFCWQWHKSKKSKSKSKKTLFQVGTVKQIKH